MYLPLKQALGIVPFFLLSGLFLTLVLVSAYLGWSATTTVNDIYLHAAAFLSSQGLTVPPNPVLSTSPLELLRNMGTYVSLIGALSAIVLGYQSIAGDRQAGTLPLIGFRPVSRIQFALGKILALYIGLTGILLLASMLNILAF